MEEIIAAAITTIDLFVIYLLLNVKERRVVLVLWTTFLNIAFPFIGYYIGQWSSYFFYEWTTLLSGFLLCLIGVHMLLEKEEDFQMFQRYPLYLACLVSFDALSVSITFGMLQLQQSLFITASGLFSFIFSIAALYFRQKLTFFKKLPMTSIAGVVLIILGIMAMYKG
ncbi:MAG TPA: manganese efflux pump [Sporosarcina sp.]|nr:manganese efflux pump [Sporosarcina sp.]